MVKQDKNNINQFGNSFIDLVNHINYCKNCYSVSDNTMCEICLDQKEIKKLFVLLKMLEY